MGIRIKGARENNLKSVDVEFQPGLTVVTGVSGSGKTSLVFETLYHEARRRFEEAFSFGSVAERLNPAQVDSITGLGPAVAVGQNLLNRNPNSTLATASGLHPFLRLLYARFGTRTCPVCGESISRLSEDEIVAQIVHINREQRVSLIAPLVRDSVGSHSSLLKLLLEKFGKDPLIVDGESYTGMKLDPEKKHSISLLLEELDLESPRQSIREKVQQARALGTTAISIKTKKSAQTYSTAQSCSNCGTWFTQIQPKDFHKPMTKEAQSVTWMGYNIEETQRLDVDKAYQLFIENPLSIQAERLFHEINNRLESLRRVGLGYVTLDRPSPTLSRGESQRVRLAVSLTSSLEDALHVLDEPTIGQHPHDITNLVPAFRELKGPVIYIEHDRVAAALADHVVDIGPGAGAQGGEMVFNGSPSGLWEADTATGRYFSLRERVQPGKKRAPPREFISIKGATAHNLKNIDIRIPVGRLTTITGVSGSGKSTIIEDVLVESLRKKETVGCRVIECSLKPVLVDQSPIGRNPRSNPATYTKLSDMIRDYYAEKTGLSPSHFSFNRPEGAYPTCKGMGALEMKMRYLPSTWITCTDCGGRRYSDEVLEAAIDIGGRILSIADFYELSIQEAHQLLRKTKLEKSNRRKALRLLKALEDIGLGYLTLGQPSPTLSGGEAQRVKLVKYLGGGTLDDHLIVLDDPSTGLHPQDISGLLKVLDNLVDRGATALVVEHNTDIIRSADWVIDLGPGPGAYGGEIVAQGSPEDVARLDSVTGRWLRNREKKAAPRGRKPKKWITVEGARENNLKGETIKTPLDTLVGICGVSGSGKSTLIIDTLGRALDPIKHTTSVAKESLDPGAHDSITNQPKKTQIIDQTRKGIQSPAKFLGIDKKLVKIFSESPEAHALGLDEKKLGKRCSVCRGSGAERIDMGFLPSIYTECETCNGTGYSQEAWDVKLHGYSLPEINQLTITEVYELFRDDERIVNPLKAAIDVGLTYLVLHQPGYSLSGGEAQRLKIAAKLAKKSGKGTLYILDEPTLGQHMEDVERLVNVLQRLVDEENSVIVVEHHPSVLAQCDWLIELGLEGGEGGGYVIASCPPDELHDTPTAPFVEKLLEASR